MSWPLEINLFLKSKSTLIGLISLLYINVPMIGRLIMFCLNLVLLSGMHLSCCNDTGFISMILLNKSFDRAFAMITGAVERLVAATLTGFPITSFTKAVIICTYM